MIIRIRQIKVRIALKLTWNQLIFLICVVINITSRKLLNLHLKTSSAQLIISSEVINDSNSGDNFTVGPLKRLLMTHANVTSKSILQDDNEIVALTAVSNLAP